MLNLKSAFVFALCRLKLQLVVGATLGLALVHPPQVAAQFVSPTVISSPNSAGSCSSPGGSASGGSSLFFAPSFASYSVSSSASAHAPIPQPPNFPPSSANAVWPCPPTESNILLSGAGSGTIFIAAYGVASALSVGGTFNDNGLFTEAGGSAGGFALFQGNPVGFWPAAALSRTSASTDVRSSSIRINVNDANWVLQIHDQTAVRVNAPRRIDTPDAHGEAIAYGGWTATFLPGNFDSQDEPCANLFTQAVNVMHAVDLSQAAMVAAFTPNFGLTLAEAATKCGYSHFNWNQIVISAPNPPPLVALPFVDPQRGAGPIFGPLGTRAGDAGAIRENGRTLEVASQPINNFPFYWDEAGPTGTGFHISDKTTANTLFFLDIPGDPLFLPGQHDDFATSLVGIRPDGTWDVLNTFTWSTNNTGSVTGLGVFRNLQPTLGGTGGVFAVRTNVDLSSLPLAVRQRMIADGAQNVQVDTSAPIIVPSIAGTVGTNGWYQSNVAVTWSVTDPESGIASSSGCGPINLTTNTPGTTLTCSATNGAGLSNTASVTIKIDRTPPVIAQVISGTPGNNGWYRSPVTVNWTANDLESGVAASIGCGVTTLTADTPGTTLTCSATNGAGLSSSMPVMVKIDKTPPVISGMPAQGCKVSTNNNQTGNNDGGNLVKIATVTAADVLSGLAPGSLKVTGTSNQPSNDPKKPQIVITPNGAGGFVVQVVADSSGNSSRVYTLTATASDLAGNAATVTGVCTVPNGQQ